MLTPKKTTGAEKGVDHGEGIAKYYRDNDSDDGADDLVEPAAAPRVPSGQALQNGGLHGRRARLNDATAAADTAAVGLVPGPSGRLLDAGDVEVDVPATIVHVAPAVRPELAEALPLVAAAEGAAARGPGAELQGVAALECDGPWQARAARVEVEVGVGAVVDEPARGLAAGVADCALVDGRWRRWEKPEHAAFEQMVMQRGGCVGEGAARVEADGARRPGGTRRVPGAVAELLAAVTMERRASTGGLDQFERVRRVGGVGGLHGQILVLIVHSSLILS